MIETSVVVGDRDRILSFISTLLDEKNNDAYKEVCHRSIKKNDGEFTMFDSITVRFNDKYSIISKNDSIMIESPFIPQGYELKFKDYNSIVSDFRLDEIESECLLLLFSFRFEKMIKIFDYIKRDLKKDKYKPLRIKAVLFDDPDVHTGSTDISNPETEYKDTLKLINDQLRIQNLSNIIDVIEYRNSEDTYSLFYGGDRTLCYSTDIIYDVFDCVKSELNVFKNDKYVFILRELTEEFWDLKNQSQLTEYKVVNKSNNLLMTYINTFFESDIWKELVKRLRDEYFDVMKCISFWNLEKDWDSVNQKLKKESEQYLMKISIPVTDIVHHYSDEISYEKFISKTKYDVIFKNTAEALMENKIPVIFVEELMKKLFIF